MQKITTNKCHETNHMGNYSCLVAEFHLHRSIGFHLIQSYLPSILIVAISWVSFWMDVDCVPARVTLGVITLLTVSSQVSGKKNLQYQEVHFEKLFSLAKTLHCWENPLHFSPILCTFKIIFSWFTGTSVPQTSYVKVTYEEWTPRYSTFLCSFLWSLKSGSKEGLWQLTAPLEYTSRCRWQHRVDEASGSILG